MSALDEIMNDKKYETPYGVKCTLDQLVKIEPEWAANRIREGEKAIARIVELKGQIKKFDNSYAINKQHIKRIGKLEARGAEFQAVVGKLESELYGAIEQAHLDGQYAGTDGVNFPHIAAQQYRIEYADKHATEKS